MQRAFWTGDTEQKQESFTSAGENNETSLAAVKQASWGKKKKKQNKKAAEVEKHLC